MTPRPLLLLSCFPSLFANAATAPGETVSDFLSTNASARITVGATVDESTNVTATAITPASPEMCSLVLVQWVEVATGSAATPPGDRQDALAVYGRGTTGTDFASGPAVARRIQAAATMCPRQSPGAIRAWRPSRERTGARACPAALHRCTPARSLSSSRARVRHRPRTGRDGVRRAGA